MGEYASKGVAGAGLGTGIVIWELETRIATERISEIEYKLSMYSIL